MGKVLRFDARRRRHRPPRRSTSTWREAFTATRPFILLIVLVTGIVLWREPDLVGAPDFLATEPQVVDANWTRCSGDWSQYCVLDGDTFRIGRQSYRVMGFDTPETKARCAAEARLAERATQALQDWMNAGPFHMQGRWDEPTDRYGRQLRELYRPRGGEGLGGREWVGDAMVAQGLARRYYGGGRDGWC